MSRWAAALILPVGPAAIAILRLILPYDTFDNSSALVTKVADNMAAQRWVVILTIVALFTLVPGAFGLMRLTRRTAPRLTVIAGALLVAGYLGLFGGWSSADFIAYGGTTAGISTGTLTKVVDATVALPALNLTLTVFIIGHILGSVLFGFVLWRSAVVSPVWAAAMGISQPLHLAAAIAGNHPLDFFAWVLTTAAMTAAAWAIIRTPDDEWDLPSA